MTLPPGHERTPGPALRETPARLVLRTSVNGAPCVTRILRAERLDPFLARTVRGIALTGRGSGTGLGDDLALTLEGYRVAAGLPPASWRPRVVDAGLTPDGFAFFTTEWVEGNSLAELPRPLVHARREVVAPAILAILAELHAQHVAYGDLKPQNIVLTPEGTLALIDLDTLRQVTDPTSPAPTRDLTPEWAAPEQRHGRKTWLASDLYSFALLVTWLWPDGPPEPWRPALHACREEDPLRRPHTMALAAVLMGETVPLLDWRDQEIVPAAPPPDRPPATTDDPTRRVADTTDDPTRRVPESDSPVVPRPSPPSGGPLFSLGGCAWSGAAAMLAVFGVCSGGVYAYDKEQIQSANSAAADTLLAIEAYKTQPRLNRDRSQRSRLRESAEAAWNIRATPTATGVRALTLVWEQGWQDSGRAWDADAWWATRKELASAAEVEEPTAMLAWATLEGARCRHDRTDPTAAASCNHALAWLDKFTAVTPSDSTFHWLRVEALWTEVLVRGAGAMTARSANLPDADSRLDATLARCDAAQPILSFAPVNGPELVQDCLRFAGQGERLPDYFTWARWLLERDAADGELELETLGQVYEAGGKGCRVSASRARPGWTVKGDPWCLALGHAARGCVEESRSVIASRGDDAAGHPWGTLEAALVRAPAICVR